MSSRVYVGATEQSDSVVDLILSLTFKIQEGKGVASLRQRCLTETAVGGTFTGAKH